MSEPPAAKGLVVSNNSVADSGAALWIDTAQRSRLRPKGIDAFTIRLSQQMATGLGRYHTATSRLAVTPKRAPIQMLIATAVTASFNIPFMLLTDHLGAERKSLGIPSPLCHFLGLAPEYLPNTAVVLVTLQ